MSVEYRAGDIIKMSRTLQVERVTSVNGLMLVDVQNGETYYHNPHRDHGTLKIEMVKRANGMSRGPKPQAGATLYGRDIKRIWWKRGTIFRLHGAMDVSGLVLKEDAKLYPLGNVSDPDGDQVYEFDDLIDDVRFDLLHVA